MKKRELLVKEEKSIPDWLKKIRERESIAWVCFWGNFGLAVLKVAAAVFYGDSLTLADGIHSAINAVMIITVLAGLKLSEIPPDDTHSFGHGKAEHICSVLAGIIVIIAGVFMFLGSVSALRGKYESAASIVSVVIAFNSIIVNMVLYKYVKSRGEELQSRILVMSSKNNFLNALTSSVVLIGVIMGEFIYFRWEQMALIVIAVIVTYGGIERLRFGINRIMDRRLVSEELGRKNEVVQVAMPVSGVSGIEDVRLKNAGDREIVYLNIRIKNSVNLGEAHEICMRLEERIKRNLSYVENVFIEYDPEHE